MAFVNWSVPPEREDFQESFAQRAPVTEKHVSAEKYQQKQETAWNAWSDPRENIYVNY